MEKDTKVWKVMTTLAILNVPQYYKNVKPKF